jgi:hypothetical protein
MLGQVVALVVVLGDRLPVRSDRVLVPRGHEHPLGFPGRHQLFEVAHVLGQRERVAAGVHEDPAVPLLHPSGGQRVVLPVEARDIPEARGALQSPVEPVDPGVVGALDRSEVAALARLEQLVPTVTACVGEGSEAALFAAHQQDPLGADPNGLLIAELREIAGSRDAQPPTFEEVPDLPSKIRAEV